jgi:hypothetical protein
VAQPPALSDADVTGLRARVQAGEKPRVVVRAASAAVPAGTRGNIVRIGNPADGEYVVVRLGKDEVPFAPNELGLPGRTAAPPAEAPSPRSGSAPAGAKARTAKTTAARTTPKPPAPAAAAKAPAAAAAARPTRVPARSKSTASRRTLPPLTVTLRFDTGGWTVEAARGSRRLAKASPVRPGAVKAFADLVDEGPVRSALTETVESCRSVVEERAAQLREELHAAEATLKEYEAKRR